MSQASDHIQLSGSAGAICPLNQGCDVSAQQRAKLSTKPSSFSEIASSLDMMIVLITRASPDMGATSTVRDK
jgi:hypothetical protein